MVVGGGPKFLQPEFLDADALASGRTAAVLICSKNSARSAADHIRTSSGAQAFRR